MIDILVPNYNKGAFIVDTIRDLKAQTHTNWRCWIEDGFSTDDSWSLIKAEVSGDLRFIVSQARRPQGSSTFYSVWNRMLREVDSPYFAILTSDDRWPANWLEVGLSRLEDCRSAVAYVGRTRCIDIEGRVGALTDYCKLFEDSMEGRWSSDGIIRSAHVCSRALMLGPIFSSVHSIICRSFVTNSLLFSDFLGFAADHDFYIKLSAAGDIVYDRDAEVYFRLYGSQASSSVSPQSKAKLYVDIMRSNSGLVASRIGWSMGRMTPLVDAVADMVLFTSMKPTGGDFRKGFVSALFRFVCLALKSPRLMFQYAAAKFFGRNHIDHLALQMTMLLDARH